MVAQHAKTPFPTDIADDTDAIDIAMNRAGEEGAFRRGNLDERRVRIILAIAINLAVPILLWLMFPLSEKTDDLTMKYVMSGAFSGTPDPHLLYSSYLLGLILSFLQGIFPSMAWFELSQYFALFLGFTAFTYLMLGLKKFPCRWLVIGVVLLFFGFEGYIKLTFTKTAGICVGSGFLLMLHGFLETQTKRDMLSESICGAVLVVVGSLFRHRMTFSALPIFVGIAILVAFNRRKDNARFAKEALVIVAAFLIPFAVSYGLSMAGGALFRMDEGWAAYKEYNPYKAALQDYGWPSYSLHEAEYQAIGVSRSDYVMWTNRDYGDPDLLSTDVWEQIASLKDPIMPIDYLKGLKGFFRTYPMALLDFRTIGAVIVVFAVYLLSDSEHRKTYIGFFALLFFAEYLYLYVNGRHNVNHVDTSMAFFFVCCVCYLLNGSHIDRQRARAASLFAVAICVWAINDNSKYITTPTYTGSAYTIEKREAKSILTTLSNDKDSLYIMSNDEYYGLLRAFGTLEVPPQGFFDNMFVLSSYMFPTHMTVLENRGIGNIYEAFCDDNVYYVTSDAPGNAKAILSYLQEHYYPFATYELDHQVGSVSVYKFYSNIPVEPEPEPEPEPIVEGEPVSEESEEGIADEEYVEEEEYSEEESGW